jgi:hypothetical protein
MQHIESVYCCLCDSKQAVNTAIMAVLYSPYWSQLACCKGTLCTRMQEINLAALIEPLQYSIIIADNVFSTEDGENRG